MLQVYNSIFSFIECLNVRKLCRRRSATCLSYIGAPRSTVGVLPEGTKSISGYSESPGPFAALLSYEFGS